jgi:hypothetical protein
MVTPVFRVTRADGVFQPPEAQGRTPLSVSWAGLAPFLDLPIPTIGWHRGGRGLPAEMAEGCTPC